MPPTETIKAVIFDWAGTTIDYGCQAPAAVFQQIFTERGVPVSVSQARGPMGKSKRDHIAAIFDYPDVAARWREKYGIPPDDAAIDELYARFLPLQKEILARHSDVIPGIPEMTQQLHARGIRIGSTTGYTRELMSVVTPLAAAGGYAPEVLICSDDVRIGRPAPWMLLAAMERLNVYPPTSVVKVDDTPVGIEAGRNAGCWTVGIALTGNECGLTQAEAEALTTEEREKMLAPIRDKLFAAGAHDVLDSAAQLPELLHKFQAG